MRIFHPLLPSTAVAFSSLLVPSIAPAQPAIVPDVLSAIAARQEDGRLNETQVWQARAQALLAPDRLPPDLAALPLPPQRCLTPMLLELRRHEAFLDPQSRLTLTARTSAASLPPSAGSVKSSRYPITVHYRLSTQVSQATYVLSLAETSWATEVTRLGFAAPLPDNAAGGDNNLDLYLATSTSTSGGAYTQPSYVDASTADVRRSCPAYIVLNEEIEDDLMTVYVAHEFNHVCQAAMDYEEFSWAWEATATFMEDAVYDDVNDYYGYIASFQTHPEQNLIYYSDSFDPYDPYILYPYGACIFLHFLNESISNGDATFAAELWQKAEQSSTVNEPDFLDAVDSLANEHDWNGLDEAFGRFSSWRYFAGSNDDGHHFQEGAGWPGAEVPIKATYNLKDLPREGNTGSVIELGTTYLVINAGGDGDGKQVRVSVTSSTSSRLGIIGSRIRPGRASEDELLVEEPSSSTASGAIPLKDSQTVVIGILNQGRKAYDDADVPQGASIQYSLTLEDEGEGEGGGCGCDSEGARGPYVGLWIVGTVGFLGVRRRRSSRV